MRKAAAMDWLLAAIWTTLMWLASATGHDPDVLNAANKHPERSIDLLGALGLHNTTMPGVTIIPGPLPYQPAYKLQGDHRGLKLPPAAFHQVTELIGRSPEFMISAFVKQESGNTAAIVSFADDINRYLELQSSGRRNEIRLHYTSRRDGTVNVETFPYRLADDVWHHVILSVSGSQVELLVDCHRLYKRLLQNGPPQQNFTKPAQLWLGQRNRHYQFKGAMQDVRLITGPHGYLSLCPSLDSTCPTCGQFSLLQNTVLELTRHLEELSERLVAAEGRIGKVEECDCPKSCWVNNTLHPDGATWEQDCDLCTCVHGDVQCRPVECPILTCKKPVNKTGECCQSCLRHCLFRGVFYDHGDQVVVKQCSQCTCEDGSMMCFKMDPLKQCPKLTCLPDQQLSMPGECCKFCPGADYCAKGHTCHANASCLNLQTTYACHCDQGFQGDGHTCSDIDECQQEGGLEGHHCHLNTKCVNTKGSYICECLPGYRRVDKFNCAELDECSTGEHNCDPNADCINTQGSYHCVCRPGYTGDGYKCRPVCTQRCLNGGMCVKPNVCSCRHGYMGTSCERDVDECASNLHRCTNSSVCVNMIGWYYCACKKGYKSTFIDNILGTLCDDVNECAENLHTCHPSATCSNDKGGYKCECGDDTHPSCHSCVFQGTEVANGTTLAPPGRPCERCTCINGVMRCVEPACNCSLPSAARDKCCPQCDPALACNHQEFPQVVLMHGEKWSYQCQTCECLNGEVDCWDLKCPLLPCANPIQDPGDCCPRCAAEICPSGNGTRTGEPCPYNGVKYESGAQFSDVNDPCSVCNCQVPFCAQLDGVLCCSYNLDCDDNATRTVGYDGMATAAAPTAPDQTHADDNNRKQSNRAVADAARGGGGGRDEAALSGHNKTENVRNAG
ncbi:protein kinase C-binding protein NELL1-like isoform X2 [Atheta coriaria]|uniref:protein kinase C-binding protein NELL1-like isoform X2 n=1 Tax=Dalotia coriaria TaxID=877792 RepID=UPI0031F3C93F